MREINAVGLGARAAQSDTRSLQERLSEVIEELVEKAVERRIASVAAAASAKEYLTPIEAAQLAKVKPATVRRWLREGRLARHSAGGRVVRVQRGDVEKLLTCHRRTPQNATPEELAQRTFGSSSLKRGR